MLAEMKNHEMFTYLHTNYILFKSKSL